MQLTKKELNLGTKGEKKGETGLADTNSKTINGEIEPPSLLRPLIFGVGAVVILNLLT